jgi:hypothetical protein
MTIKAVLRDGIIQPVEPLPPEWADGQELVVEQPDSVPAESQLQEWREGLEVAVLKLPQEEHDRFSRAMVDIERESKDAIRREWGLS